MGRANKNASSDAFLWRNPSTARVSCRWVSAKRVKKERVLPLPILQDPSNPPCPLDPQLQNALQQGGICNSVMERRGRELLELGDLRIGIGFNVIGRAVCGETKINSGVAIQLQRSVDALGHVPDPFRH